jgi:DNA-binding MarR family transcriptional regulator
MIRAYIDVIELLGRVHRECGKLIRKELDHVGSDDLDYLGALILWNLGEEKTTINELRNRVNLMGSHLNAIIRKLSGSGYVSSERSLQDRRVIEIWLNDKGRAVVDRLTEMHNRVFGNALAHSECVVRTLRSIEEFWSDQRLD